ncbi:MAG: MFS transporter [Nitrososphaerota archaeon]|nr:MFS transporter [Nitrososphaerota archaeon]
MDMLGSGTRSYLGAGFVLALSVRLLTTALVIVIPLFAIASLAVTTSEAGVFVLLLWVGNAAGVAAAVLALRNQSYASVGGFCLVALSMFGLGLGGRSLAPLFMLTSGAGVGLPQPFLSALMYQDSSPGRPFSGLGLYSTALGAGLILGPLVAYGAYPLYGFAGVFFALSAVCAVGVAGAALGHPSASIRPRPPTPSPIAWKEAFRGRAFRTAVLVNFLYSLLLPVFLSYGSIYAERAFGFAPTDALLLFSLVFAVSVALRLLAVRSKGRLDRLLLASVALLVVSSLMLGLAPTWQYFVAGMLLFSVPHAFVFPISNYHALSYAGGDVMNASYAFQASSAAAEFVTPAAAVLLIPFVGVHGLFLAGTILAVGALIAALPSGDGGEESTPGAATMEPPPKGRPVPGL